MNSHVYFAMKLATLISVTAWYVKVLRWQQRDARKRDDW